MGKKRPRKTKSHAEPASPTSRPKKRRRLDATSLVFIGIVVAIIVIAAVGSQFTGGNPECPPGQVWSNEHNHCH